MCRMISFVSAALVALCIAGGPAAADDADTCSSVLRDNTIAAKAVDDAIAACTRVLRRNPNADDAFGAYLGRGGAYTHKGDYDRAIADYDQVITLRPKDFVGYWKRGTVFERKGEYDRAFADYVQAERFDPKLNLLHVLRDHAQAMLGERPEQTTPVTAAPQTSPRPATAPIPLERRVALVIGNSGYRSSIAPALPNPRRDAKLVADALRQAGFETTELTDLDHPSMVKALQAFRTKADSADWALVYFAGHGIAINGANYLLPVDVKLADSRDVELEAVSYEAMLKAIEGAKALRIILLDACRNNPFKANWRQTLALRGSLDRGLAPPPETVSGTMVVYSAREGQTAVDGDGVNSPFALAFVGRLKTPGRDVRRMFDEVRDDVLNATGQRQQPYTYGSLPGSRDFFFVAGK